MPAAPFFQQVFHVFEKLKMASLVTGNCNTLNILLNGTFHYLLHTAVMSQVNDFYSFGLKDSAHDVDRCIMPVEKTGGGHHANRIAGYICHAVVN